MKRHGFSTINDKLYMVWNSMLRRCYSKTHTSYHLYGAKGVQVCEEWQKDFLTFRTWAIENGYEPDKGLSIDRIDNSKGYEPNNCRIVDLETQANNKSTTIKLTIGGVTKGISQWAREFGIKPWTARQRYHKGLPITEIFKPVRDRHIENSTYKIKLPARLNGLVLELKVVSN